MTIKVFVSKLYFFLIAIILLLRCSCQNVTCPTTLYKTTTGVRQFVTLSVDIHHQLTWKQGTQLQRGENTCVNKLLMEKQDFGMHTFIAAFFLGPCDIRVTEEDTDGTYAKIVQHVYVYLFTATQLP